MSDDFLPCGDANAFIANELSPAEREDFEAHLAICADCQREVAHTRILFRKLAAVPPATASRDFERSVLSRLQEEMPTAAPRRAVWPRIAAAAAAVAVFGTGIALLVKTTEHAREHKATARSAANGLDWLTRAQEPDGSWNAERWGGEQKFAPALCGLPLMALVVADETTPAQEEAAARAATNLLRYINEDGTFGGVFQGAPYNHSIATLALLYAWERNPHFVPKAALDSAVAALARSQTADGGWGYLYSPLSDRSITQWHVQALETAARLGWKDAADAAERGIDWLREYSDPEAEAFEAAEVVLAKATESSTANPDAPGLYQAYFTIAALRDDPTAHDRVAALQKEILERQESNGDTRGSWAPDDQWGRAGGRVYSTSLACLSMATQHHHRAIARVSSPPRQQLLSTGAAGYLPFAAPSL